MGAQKLVRYFSLAGLVDADPIILQPVVTDPTATPFGPIVTGLGGTILINAWEVDANGARVVPTGGLVLTVGVVTLSKLEPGARPPGAALTGIPSPMFMWGRGPLATATEAGEWRIQAELGEVVGFQVIVTAKAAAPATFLAIWAMRGPRGPR